MQVADADALAVLRRELVGAEAGDAAVGGLLVAVVGDGAELDRERRVNASLLEVVAGLDEVEKVIGGPVADFDDGTALGVPDDAVGVARALGEDLELMGARVDAPHGGGEVVAFAMLVNYVGLIEDAVEAVQPAVGAPGEGAGQLVEVGTA